MELVFALGSILAVNLAAWVTPGPNMVAVISVSLVGGRTLGIMTGVGLACSSLIWSVLAVFGGSALLEVFPNFAMAIKLAGAAYLGWIGFKSLRVSLSGVGMMSPNNQGTSNGATGAFWSFRHGLLIGLTNPKAIIFFGAIVTSFVPTDAPYWFLVVVVILCGGLGVPLHAITATLFSSRAAVRILEERQSLIVAATGILFCCFAGIAAFQAVLSRTGEFSF